jgi:alpha-beta hydrolase superfamily lysophospholipase
MKDAMSEQVGAEEKVSITLPGNGGNLRGDIDRRAGDFVVLWVHGLGSHRGGEKAVAIRDECRRRGWSFAAFDFRGHGESSGDMLGLTTSRLLDDLKAIRQFLAQQGLTKIGVIGSSMGGYAAAWSVRQSPSSILGCVFLAPAFRFLERRWQSLRPEQQRHWHQSGRFRVKNDWIDLELGYGLIEELDQYRFHALTQDWMIPALLFHGYLDTVVPWHESRDFFEAADFPHLELRLFRNGDHRLTAYKQEIAESAARFFLQQQ